MSSTADRTISDATLDRRMRRVAREMGISFFFTLPNNDGFDGQIDLSQHLKVAPIPPRATLLVVTERQALHLMSQGVKVRAGLRVETDTGLRLLSLESDTEEEDCFDGWASVNVWVTLR